MSAVSFDCQLMTAAEASPYILQEGVFGASCSKEGEQLFLRMELITEKNAACWKRFKGMTTWLANNDNGVLSSLVRFAGDKNQADYEMIREQTGFTREEYSAFIEKAIAAKFKTHNKIVDLLKANSSGSNHMSTFFNPKEHLYIVYISKNPDFCIEKVDVSQERSVKNYFESYSDILIAVGSNFSAKKDSFHNRGIFRNPLWVFEQKYAGLSMLLHGFSGAVADKFFPEKTEMQVLPIGSMQCLISKRLLPGEGYKVVKDEKIDLARIIASPDDPEGSMNYIQVSALVRIYYQSVCAFSKEMALSQAI